VGNGGRPDRMKRVWIAQLLCHERHCLIAMAEEIEGTEKERMDLAHQVWSTAHTGVKAGIFKRQCALCGADFESLKVEVSQTPYRTLEEARPHLKMAEEAQAAFQHIIQTLHLKSPEELQDWIRKARAARFN
jgi:hypothetical protein